jgi:periplasmic protein TonB
MSEEAATLADGAAEVTAWEALPGRRGEVILEESFPSAAAGSAPLGGIARASFVTAAIARPSPLRETRKTLGDWIGMASSFAVHGVLVALLIAYAPWGSPNLAESDDEISIELVEGLPGQATPEPEQPPSASPANTPLTDGRALPTEPPDEIKTAEPSAAPVPATEIQVRPTAPEPFSPSAIGAPPPPPLSPAAVPTKPALPSVPPPDAMPAAPSPEKIQRKLEEAASERARQRQRIEQARREQETKASAQAQAQAQAKERLARRAEEAKRQAEAQAAADAGAQVSLALASAYRGEVMGRLQSFKRYPQAARARGAQGNPAVTFSIDASGRVLSVSLTRSSGDPDIDAESLAMVRRASPFPPPPPGAPRAFSAGLNFHFQ